MFGMMFGDVGHGMVLFALGYWLFKKFYQLMDYGIITMECGVSSAIFGFLYGSIFGAEHVLPAIWLRPSENIDTFMKFAIGLGVVMISTGVILNIINSFHRKDYESGILGHYGIVGGLFYWICCRTWVEVCSLWEFRDGHEGAAPGSGGSVGNHLF
jgi:V/A-type H+-transporting ATPase subunit I